MDRDRETLRDEIFQLDEASQAWLASELEEHIAKSGHTQAWLEEVARRDAAWDRGEAVIVKPEEALRKARNLVAKRRP